MKFLIISVLFLQILSFRGVNCATIDFKALANFESDHQNPESDELDDLRIIASEPEIKFNRKDIFDALQKTSFFQDIFSERSAPMVIQFGHVCENPAEWEQRFEHRDFENQHHRGKMRWGNKNGDYGEQYWDLGHAG